MDNPSWLIAREARSRQRRELALLHFEGPAKASGQDTGKKSPLRRRRRCLLNTPGHAGREHEQNVSEC